MVVTMNRDERRDRAEARDLHRDEATTYPQDALTGGAWFGVNRFGLALALLNRYDRPINPAAGSRGRLVPAALSARSPGEVRAALEMTCSAQDSPFDLFIVSADQVERLSWNGRDLRRRRHHLPGPCFFTSSSERAASVRRFRSRIFAAVLDELSHSADGPRRAGEQLLERFHFGIEPGRERASVLMQRDATHTKSITRAVLSPSGVCLSWWPEEEIARHVHSGVPVGELRPRTHVLSPVSP